jgi:tRNA dimethylallyltransferase
MLDKRVDEMLIKGAVDEARRVLKMLEDGTVAQTNPVLKAIGLSHLLKHFTGTFTYEECIRLWKRDTRRLAKRQFTWLRKFCAPSPERVWCDPRKLSLKDLRGFVPAI